MMMLIAWTMMTIFFFSIGGLIAAPTMMRSVQEIGRDQRVFFIYSFSILAALVAFFAITGYSAALSTLHADCTLMMDAATGATQATCTSPSFWSAWQANLLPSADAAYGLWLGFAGTSGVGAWWVSVQNLRPARRKQFVLS